MPTPIGAAHLLEFGRSPLPSFHHVREQGQAHRNDPAALGQSGDGLIQELLLFRQELGTLLGQMAVGMAKLDENPTRMKEVEKIDGCRVLPSTRRRSSFRMNRVAAIQKSSRTSTTACTRRRRTAEVPRPAPDSPRRSWRRAIARTGRGRSAALFPQAKGDLVAHSPAHRPAPGLRAIPGRPCVRS